MLRCAALRWSCRHPDLIRLTGRHPFNVEPKPARLFESYITPPSLHYVRNHGAVPQIRWEDHRLAVNGEQAGAGTACFARPFVRHARHAEGVLREPLRRTDGALAVPPRASTLSFFPCFLQAWWTPPTTFTMADLLAMPSVDVTCTLTCAGEPRHTHTHTHMPLSHGCLGCCYMSASARPPHLLPLPSCSLLATCTLWPASLSAPPRRLQATGARRRTW